MECSIPRNIMEGKTMKIHVRDKVLDQGVEILRQVHEEDVNALVVCSETIFDAKWVNFDVK